MTRQRRLTRAIRAEDGEKLAVGDGQGDVGKRPIGVLFPRMEYMRKMFGTNELRHASCLPCHARTKNCRALLSSAANHAVNKTSPLYPISIVNTNKILG